MAAGFRLELYFVVQLYRRMNELDSKNPLKDLPTSASVSNMKEPSVVLCFSFSGLHFTTIANQTMGNADRSSSVARGDVADNAVEVLVQLVVISRTIYHINTTQVASTSHPFPTLHKIRC